MSMQQNLHSQTYINTDSITPPYTVATFDGKNYRILTSQYNGFIQMTKVWAVFWFCISLILLSSGIIMYFQLKIAFILLFSIVAQLLFTVYVFKKKKQLSDCILYSTVNLLIFLIPIAIFAFLQIKQIVVCLCFYITIETILSLKFMSNKSQIIAKFLILMQAMMISLKADQKIQSSWKDILFSHVVFFLFLAFCLIFMTAYLGYMIINKNQQNLMKQKIAGVLFVYLNTIGFCALSALPLFYIFFNFSLWAVSLITSLLTIFLGTYSFSYRKQIVIFFCTLSEIKSFNQIISFEPIKGISENKSNVFRKKEEKQNQNKQIFLYRISENWLTLNPQRAAQNENQNPELGKSMDNDKQEIIDCLICLDRKADIVWMPCGHLTVCMECCSFMFQKRNLNCVLCKITPTQIYVIDLKDKNSQQRQDKNTDSNKKYQQDEIQNSLQKDQVSIISTSILVQKQQIQAKNSVKDSAKDKNVVIKSQTPSEQQINFSKNKKKKFKVLQGYNVKVV